MKLLKDIFNFYINSSVHVSFAVLAISVITSLEFSVKPPLTIYAFIFFGSIVGYNFVKYSNALVFNIRGGTRPQRHIWIFTIVCLAIGLILSFQLSKATWIVTTILGVITFLYTIPILTKKNFRDFVGVKIFLVAFVWAGVTVLIPLTEPFQEFRWDYGVFLVQLFIWVIVLTLPFEIRDMEFDSQHLRTIPQKFGLKGTKFLGGVLLLITLILELLKEQNSTAYVISLVFVCVLTFVALNYSKKGQSFYYSAFWVESIPMAWLGIFLCCRYFLQ